MNVLNRTQATNNILEVVASMAQIDETTPLQVAATVHLEAYRHMNSAGNMVGVHHITDWDIIDHGIENSQYFQGCGTAFTNYENVVTGTGDNPQEALEDALESIATGYGLIPERLETIAKHLDVIAQNSNRSA